TIELLEANEKQYKKSIRINTIKIKTNKLIKRLEKKGFVETSFTVSGKRVSLTTFGSLLAQALATKLILQQSLANSAKNEDI
ncbi:MAG: hypothetical protein QXI32_04025, partial [Candidatus Bathyarchaeia archaeon]